MQKVLIAAFVLVMTGCFSEEKKPASETAKQPGAELPYTATYSSRFEIGDARQVESLMKVWKAWDDGKLAAGRQFFADTMVVFPRDGQKLEGPIDSVNAAMQAYRDQFASVSSTITAIFPVKSTDKNESWVTVWGTEVSTDKQGRTDSVALNEVWRFNKDGKIDLMYQYARLPGAVGLK